MRDPWIRVHAHLADRPVVSRMAETLRVDPYKAMGHLVAFWGGVSAHAANGRVADVPDALLERWAGWTGKRGAFASWVRAAHMDAEGRVNEWDDYQGRLESKREKDRHRVREHRRKVGDSTRDVTPDVRVTDDRQNASGNAPVATHARERYGTERYGTEKINIPAAATAREGVRETLTAPQRLAIAANRAVEARWGEQTRPLLPGHGPTVQLAEELVTAGVPLEIAEASIARQVLAKSDDPPRSLAYFRAGILGDWSAHQTRTLAAGLDPAATPPGRIRSADLIPQELCDA